MWLIEKIKAWRERRTERKIKRLERKYGLLYFHAPMGAGRYFLERDENARKAMKAVMRLEGNRYKTCMQLSSAFQEERRKLGLEALWEARRISAEIHNPEGVSFYDVQRPEGYSSNFGGLPLGNIIVPRYNTSVFKEIYENDVLGNTQ